MERMLLYVVINIFLLSKAHVKLPETIPTIISYLKMIIYCTL
jgi:hypothetical protein